MWNKIISFFTGFKEYKLEDTIVITCEEVEEIAKRSLYETDAYTYDSTYRCPTEAWLMNRVAWEYKKIAYDFKLEQYYAERNDCENKAELFHIVACKINNDDALDSVGIAVGLMSYDQWGADGWHCIPWAICDVNGEKKIRYIEPAGDPAFIELTKSEKKSARMVWM